MRHPLWRGDWRGSKAEGVRRKAEVLAWFGVLLALSFAAACSPTSRSYELHGQILEIDRTGGVVTIRHGDIKGFMPAMTMPFKVKDRRLLEGRARGDVVNGTLVVTDTDAYLTRLEVTGHADVVQAASSLPAGSVLEPGALVPDARFVGANGQPFGFSSLRGSVVALTFIYTRCPLPQFCPRLDRQFNAVFARVRSDPRLRESVRLLSISFDPEYDTPAVLSAHARSAGADGRIWRFVTADRQTLDSFTAHFGMVIIREDAGSFTHNLRTAIVDRQSRLVKIYDGNQWTADELAADLAKASGR